MTLTSEHLHRDSVQLPAHLRIQSEPLAPAELTIRGDTYRFTVLTSRMIRMEYSPDGTFEDRPSQLALNRNFDAPEFRVIDDTHHLQIITEHLHLSYDKQRFSPNGLTIQVKGKLSAYHSLWRYSEAGENLGGTARTLDEADGSIPLEPGLMSRNGYSVLDDSASLLLDGGWFSPRTADTVDLYFFGYGRSYRQCLQDFYHLSGRTPLLPRFTLGNWWSRYHRYTAEEYKELIERFQDQGIPFSVAVLDMDWHLVDIDPKHGSGWTGYTWNRGMFPDPDGFTDWLHSNGLRLTLNVHPAEGLRAHEDAYAVVARELGIDPASEDPIVFDVTDPAFLTAYFEHVHHPLEDRGVDFWWLDWQSGSHSKIMGMDPLWVLNHLHFLDSARDGKRPLTFSRYAGPGSHRYPIGFSGDTIVTWESLDFQPYFTATASNIGYGWWSHDIGGHMGGYKDNDLAVRWTQFGVFSPIMRLHSGASPFTGKEPWRYPAAQERIMADFLRLRHRLVPYLHTMNHRAAHEGLPLIEPMYYEYPEDNAAYTVPNQYLFGTELMMAPVTTPSDPSLNLGRVKTWLPEGIWIDFFTGLIYRGDRSINLYRPLEHIPALARAGSVIPLTSLDETGNGTPNPGNIEIRIFAGASGTFTLIEDHDASTKDSSAAPAKTPMHLDWHEGTFTVEPATGDLSHIPAQRGYELTFVGFDTPKHVTVTSGGRKLNAARTYAAATNSTTLRVENIAADTGLTVTFHDGMRLASNDVTKRVFELLADAQIDFATKESVFAKISGIGDLAATISYLQAMDLNPNLLGAISELLLACPQR
ncbi:glycoside hydrolase family 31 protein [Arthrobacter sp. OY3WO11]|uniref:glycoside hydrolase family 31 protein n=1 Tax=Arthrobacter sp. OY3WO11 TaxID=1835723 RepID=UPI0007CFB722|nr:glycoside hydrolase family 31 protein [Arthrobacter sp. OY3WO11]OAE03094.1 alpha-xylosidase [Arthrobacter sp. OY3WO11]